MDALLQHIHDFLPLDSLCRLLVAVFAGAVIGWEREQQDKPAGLRTHILVSLGAAVFMIGALELSEDMQAANPAVRLDPIRAMAGIIGGVGFLGAGSIIQSRGEVRGITTAASIWISAAIGTSCGMGHYQLAITCGILALIVLWAIGKIEFRLMKTKVKSEKADHQPD